MLMSDHALIKEAREQIYAEQMERFDAAHFNSSQEAEWLETLREQVDGEKEDEVADLKAKIQRIRNECREAESAATAATAELADAKREQKDQVSTSCTFADCTFDYMLTCWLVACLCSQASRLLSEASERAATAAREHAAALDAACREKQQVSMLA